MLRAKSTPSFEGNTRKQIADTRIHRAEQHLIKIDSGFQGSRPGVNVSAVNPKRNREVTPPKKKKKIVISAYGLTCGGVKRSALKTSNCSDLVKTC